MMTGNTLLRFLYTAVLLPGALYAQQPLKLNINGNKTYQTIENFGASDAWAGQFAGNWPEAKRAQMADWLFSMDTLANGQPKGIGLTMWRFNLGAGSAQQGSESGIRDEWRRAESFLEKDGSYNWDRQAAQQWFLKAAKQRGVPYFLAFYNSPPVEFTKNKKAFSDKGQCNIDSTQFNALAVYTANVLKGIQRKTGVLFDYISPVNEPQWDWMDGGQEGNPYWNKDVSGLVKALSATLKKERISTKIIIPESGHIKYLLEDGDKPGRGNQVNELLKPGGAHYVGNLVEKVAAAHSYFSTSPQSASEKLRTQVAERIASVKGLRFWQSEYCILGDNEGEISGNRKDTGMKAALYVARVIHTDLAVANATAWQWWLAISAYNYKDGLIYIEKNKTDGHLEDSKMMWALGNYSRFVRPGMQRIEASIAGAGQHLFVSAYKSKKNTVVVIVNTGAHAESIQLGGKHAVTYTTATGEELVKGYADGNAVIKAESIVTLVM
ncbi:glycoside hydrolase [uncultured Chitinophaga sp.]|uniref:glycoside hydrolase n=1 Tax=uncultured Chitinophaga sp. TaxID=339340 RepID=UPI0025EA51AB|nr:glycoside hydrolase [uncultured Chitinophaga sp.]